jgi:2-dehydropantoate 2-reductase
MEPEPLLEIVSPAGQRLQLSRAQLAALPAAQQVADVGMIVRGKQGRGVWLAALLEKLGDGGAGAWLNLGSRDPAFAVSLPLSELPRGALVVYELDGAALPAGQGGPFRLLVPGHEDECVNVKSLAKIELARARGRDTRPADDEAHRALHAQKKKA